MALRNYLKPFSNYFFGELDKRFYYQAYSFLREFEKDKKEIEHLKKERRFDFAANNLCILLTGASIAAGFLITPPLIVLSVLSESFRETVHNTSRAYKETLLAFREAEIEFLREHQQLDNPSDNPLKDL